MPIALRWISADLALLPDDGKRYEIIDGESYVSRPPHWHHQYGQEVDVGTSERPPVPATSRWP